MTIQISKHPIENKIEVYKNHHQKVGELKPSDFGTAFSWNGEDVINFFLDVLTDCNYHTERKQIEKALTNESKQIQS